MSWTRSVSIGGLVILMLGGCASTQLNYNTLDLASTVDSLLSKQVLLNLSRFIDDDSTLPTQVTIAAGTISTTNALSPSVSGVPLAKSSTITNTVATAAATTVTSSNAAARAAAALAGSATNTASQTWTIDPSTDAFELSRMRALYRYAICRDFLVKCDHILFKEYPVQTTTDNNKQSVRDVNYLVPPRCVICLRKEDDSATPNLPILNISTVPSPANSRINPTLHKLHIGWLRFNGFGATTNFQNPPSEGMIDLGEFAGHELFVSGNDLSALSEFTLFVEGATTAGSASAASGGTKVQKTFNIIAP